MAIFRSYRNRQIVFQEVMFNTIFLKLNFFDSQVHARNGYLAKASHESKRLLLYIFNISIKNCQII